MVYYLSEQIMVVPTTDELQKKESELRTLQQEIIYATRLGVQEYPEDVKFWTIVSNKEKRARNLEDEIVELKGNNP